MSLRKTWRPGDAFLLLHKDTDLVVVDKKAGVLTVGRPSGRGVDLMKRLTELLGSRATIIPVHRLDRPVSGVLVVARHARAERALREQFAAHDVERRYIAAVSGILAEDTGTYESTLASEGRTLRMHSAEEGRTAVTHWRVLERFPGADATLVEVALETGRRNQIRVHFAEAGHPLRRGWRPRRPRGLPEHVEVAGRGGERGVASGGGAATGGWRGRRNVFAWGVWGHEGAVQGRGPGSGPWVARERTLNGSCGLEAKGPKFEANSQTF